METPPQETPPKHLCQLQGLHNSPTQELHTGVLGPGQDANPWYCRHRQDSFQAQVSYSPSLYRQCRVQGQCQGHSQSLCQGPNKTHHGRFIPVSVPCQVMESPSLSMRPRVLYLSIDRWLLLVLCGTTILTGTENVFGDLYIRLSQVPPRIPR